MGLPSAVKQDFRLTFSTSCRPVSVHTDVAPRMNRQVQGNNILVTARTWPGFKVPKLGSRAQRMLVCQPPLKAMNVYADCCSGYCSFSRREVEATETIQSATGITIGDIIDTAPDLMQEHQTCPVASRFKHDREGKVNVKVTFEGVVAVSASDGMLLLKKQTKVKDRKKQKKRDAWEKRLESYIEAKQTGKCLIPCEEKYVTY